MVIMIRTIKLNLLSVVETCLRLYFQTQKNIIYVNIVFRVNLTQENAHEYKSLQSMILERFKYNKMIAIAPAFIQDRSSVGCKPNNLLFNHKTTSQYILKLSQKGIDSTYIRYPQNVPFETK